MIDYLCHKEGADDKLDLWKVKFVDTVMRTGSSPVPSRPPPRIIHHPLVPCERKLCLHLANGRFAPSLLLGRFKASADQRDASPLNPAPL